MGILVRKVSMRKDIGGRERSMGESGCPGGRALQAKGAAETKEGVCLETAAGLERVGRKVEDFEWLLRSGLCIGLAQRFVCFSS